MSLRAAVAISGPDSPPPGGSELDRPAGARIRSGHGHLWSLPDGTGLHAPTASWSGRTAPDGCAATCAAGGSGPWAAMSASTVTPRRPTGRRWASVRPRRSSRPTSPPVSPRGRPPATTPAPSCGRHSRSARRWPAAASSDADRRAPGRRPTGRNGSWSGERRSTAAGRRWPPAGRTTVPVGWRRSGPGHCRTPAPAIRRGREPGHPPSRDRPRPSPVAGGDGPGRHRTPGLRGDHPGRPPVPGPDRGGRRRRPGRLGRPGPAGWPTGAPPATRSPSSPGRSVTVRPGCGRGSASSGSRKRSSR